MSDKRFLDFASFLNEAEDNGSSKIVILSSSANPSKTSKSFLEECEKRSIECLAVNVNSVKLKKLYNGHLLTDESSKKEIIIKQSDTVIIPRRGVIENSYTKQIMRDLEEARYFCLNSLDSIEVCENKYLTSVILEQDNLPVPRYSLIPNEESLDSALEAVGGEFPVIMKLLSGTQGIGVSIVDSYASMKSVYQTIKKLNPESEILIQEKIDSNFDVRIQVITKNFDPLYSGKDNCIILGAMKREAVGKDFRTNYSLGGEVKNFDLSEELEDIACKAANAVGCHWCGVDIMIDKKSNKPYILEVNSSPGTEGISKAIGKPIVDEVINFVEKNSNWTYSKMEIGYLESISIEGIGKMVAKFDTGNGSTSCSIHADVIEETGDKLKWQIGDKKFESDIVDISVVEIGSDRIERPVVEIDIIFDGAIIEKVRVSPIDRTIKSSPFLANRRLMKRLGVMVNPNKAFVVTEKPHGEYSPKDTKGEKHGGIEFE